MKFFSNNWRSLPLLGLAGVAGVLGPFMLYRHSTFFGWSAPRGGETITIIAFLVFMIVMLFLFRKSTIGLLTLASFFLGSLVGFLSPWIQYDPFWAKPDIETPEQIWEVKRVAHAGGSIDGIVYSNSLEAMEENKEFFDYIELDFKLTSDGALICMHGYGEDRHRYIFGEVIEASVSFSEFQELNKNGDLTACDVFGLEEWVLENPEKFIVTDIKESGRNVELLGNLRETNPDLVQNLIPQAYSFDEVFSLHKLGFEKVILTTYRMGPLDEENFLERAEQAPLFAVTMSSGQAGNLSAELARIGIPSYVYTVNDHDWFARLRELAVSNIYTDVLSDTLEGY